MKEKGLDNNLLDLIAADPAFGLNEEELKKTMDPAKYVGRAPLQVENFLKKLWVQFWKLIKMCLA